MAKARSLPLISSLAFIVLVSCGQQDENNMDRRLQVSQGNEGRASSGGTSPKEDNARPRRVQSGEGGQFGEGSSMDEVKAIMGTPDDQRDVPYRGTIVWTYSFSSVTFRSGKVIDWVDGSRNLKAKKRPGRDVEPKKRDHEAEMRLAAKELGIEESEYLPAGLSTGARRNISPGGPTNPNVVRVEGYTTKSGARVETHYRTRGDARRTNNFGSRGNVNPYSGKRGYSR